MNAKHLAGNPTMLGQVFENFVGMELLKQISWSDTRPGLFHFRTLQGQEVDFVLENRAGEIVGIEVKSSATVTAQDFKHIKILSEIAGKNFHRGVVLYAGERVIPFGENLFAIPVHDLWR